MSGGISDKSKATEVVAGPYLVKYRITQPNGETAWTVFEREGPLLTPVLNLKTSGSAQDMAHLLNVAHHDRNNRKAAAKIKENLQERGLSE